MKTTTKKFLAASGLAVAVTVVGVLSQPTSTTAFTTIGGSLSTGQRDFRVFNGFTNGGANNNTTANPQFPGTDGAEMAIWKGVIEWNGEPWGGTGVGDGVSSNPELGSGDANFDAHWQGNHTGNGGSNGNVVAFQSSGSSCGGSTLAFMQGPISDGWTIRFCPGWSWTDGPGNNGGVDIQGVGCHEYGHALGLGHSTASGTPTMQAFISGSGSGQRSIENDDINGVKFVYGTKSATKPQIFSITGSSSIGSLMTITGEDFSTSGNEVWFTNSATTGTATKVTGVSSTGGGTQIVVTVPGGVMDGNVGVKKNASGHTSLSEFWPFDAAGGGGDFPNLVSVTPNVGPTGGFTEVVLAGIGFTGTTDVDFGSSAALSFTVDSGTQITAVTPPGTLFDSVIVTVTDNEGSSALSNGYFYSFDPAPSIDTVSPNSGPVAGGTVVTVSGSTVVGVTNVTFDGVSGTGLQILNEGALRVTTPAGSSTGPVNVVAFGNGNDSIAGGFTYADSGEFIRIEPGLAGTIGIPNLNGTGDLSPGGAGFTLTTNVLLPFTAGITWVSLVESAVPFKGGLLYAFPIVLEFNVASNLFGIITLPGAIDVTIPPGTEFILQQGFADTGAIKNVSLSNGLKLVVGS